MTIRLVTIRNEKNGSLLQTAFDTTDDYEVFDIKHSQEPVAMCFFTSDENHTSLSLVVCFLFFLLGVLYIFFLFFFVVVVLFLSLAKHCI